VPHFALDTPASATAAVLPLNQHRMRFNDPVTGRWTTRDPIGYADGMSLYEFLRSAPLYWLDAAGWTIIIDPTGAGAPDIFRWLVEAALEKMKEDPDLKKVVEDLENSEETVVIKPSKKPQDSTKPDNEASAENGNGTGSVVEIHPEPVPIGAGYESEVIPGIAHELSHADDAAKGIRDPKRCLTCKLPLKERKAIDRENKVNSLCHNDKERRVWRERERDRLRWMCKGKCRYREPRR